MNTPPLPECFTDELDALELKVAQRADELARESPSGGSARRDLQTWLRAEHEAFALADAETVRVLTR